MTASRRRAGAARPRGTLAPARPPSGWTCIVTATAPSPWAGPAHASHPTRCRQPHPSPAARVRWDASTPPTAPACAAQTRPAPPRAPPRAPPPAAARRRTSPGRRGAPLETCARPARTPSPHTPAPRTPLRGHTRPASRRRPPWSPPPPPPVAPPRPPPLRPPPAARRGAPTLPPAGQPWREKPAALRRRQQPAGGRRVPPTISAPAAVAAPRPPRRRARGWAAAGAAPPRRAWPQPPRATPRRRAAGGGSPTGTARGRRGRAATDRPAARPAAAAALRQSASGGARRPTAALAGAAVGGAARDTARPRGAATSDGRARGGGDRRRRRRATGSASAAAACRHPTASAARRGVASRVAAERRRRRCRCRRRRCRHRHRRRRCRRRRRGRDRRRRLARCRHHRRSRYAMGAAGGAPPTSAPTDRRRGRSPGSGCAAGSGRGSGSGSGSGSAPRRRWLAPCAVGGRGPWWERWTRGNKWGKGHAGARGRTGGGGPLAGRSTRPPERARGVAARVGGADGGKGAPTSSKQHAAKCLGARDERGAHRASSAEWTETFSVIVDALVHVASPLAIRRRPEQSRRLAPAASKALASVGNGTSPRPRHCLDGRSLRPLEWFWCCFTMAVRSTFLCLDVLFGAGVVLACVVGPGYLTFLYLPLPAFAPFVCLFQSIFRLAFSCLFSACMFPGVGGRRSRRLGASDAADGGAARPRAANDRARD